MTQYAIRCVGSSELIALRTEAGARRHALEHAQETGLVVEALTRESDDGEWRRFDLVDPAQIRSPWSAEQKLARLQAWLATYPDFPADVTGDPEAMVVNTVRRDVDRGP